MNNTSTFIEVGHKQVIQVSILFHRDATIVWKKKELGTF